MLVRQVAVRQLHIRVDQDQDPRVRTLLHLFTTSRLLVRRYMMLATLVLLILAGVPVRPLLQFLRLFRIIQGLMSHITLSLVRLVRLWLLQELSLRHSPRSSSILLNNQECLWVQWVYQWDPQELCRLWYQCLHCRLVYRYHSRKPLSSSHRDRDLARDHIARPDQKGHADHARGLPAQDDLALVPNHDDRVLVPVPVRGRGRLPLRLCL